MDTLSQLQTVTGLTVLRLFSLGEGVGLGGGRGAKMSTLYFILWSSFDKYGTDLKLKNSKKTKF